MIKHTLRAYAQNGKLWFLFADVYQALADLISSDSSTVYGSLPEQMRHVDGQPVLSPDGLPLITPLGLFILTDVLDANSHG